MPKMTIHPLFSGRFSNEVAWEFYQASELPELNLCTAVFCTPFQDKNILLVEHQARGWEMPGGHVEAGDEGQLLTALEREVMEEGGVSVKNMELFGYRKIIASIPQKMRGGIREYPFPVSYIPFYNATVSIMHEFSAQHETMQRKLFSREEASAVLNKHGNDKIVEYAYSLFSEMTI